MEAEVRFSTLSSQHEYTLIYFLRSGSSSQSSDNENISSNTGVSVAALAGAVAGVVAGLLAITAVIVFLGRRRGWFMSERYIAEYMARPQPGQQHQLETLKATDAYGSYHGYHNIAQLPADDVHQAP